MRHSIPRSPQFYVTAPQECPYLENRVERKLFTALNGPESQILNNVWILFAIVVIEIEFVTCLPLLRVLFFNFLMLD